MSLIKRGLRHYIGLNFHVSFSLMSLTVLTYFKSDLPVDLFYVAFAGLGTLAVYTYIKQVPAEATLKSAWRAVTRESPAWVHVISVLALCLVGRFNPSQVMVLVASIFLSVAYILPWPLLVSSRRRERKSTRFAHTLRDFGAIKIIIVALVWSSVSIVLPLLAYGPISINIVMLFLAQTMWVIVLTIPFEIRDTHKDQLRHPTWPQKMGLFRVKAIGIVLLIMSLFVQFLRLNFIEQEASHVPSYLDVPYLFTMGLTAFGLLWAKPNQSFWYSAFWIEAIPIVWLVLSGFNFVIL